MTVAVATTALTTLATVKTELGILDSSLDDVIARLINAASVRILRATGRRRLAYSAAYVEDVAGYGTGSLVLSLTPVRSVASLSFDGSAQTTSDLELPAFNAGEDNDGIVRRSGGFLWTAATAGESVTGQGVIGSERRLYRVTYAGGFICPGQATAGPPALVRDLPEDLEQACIDLVTSLYRRRGRDQGITAESILGESVAYDTTAGDMPASVWTAIAPYMRLS